MSSRRIAVVVLVVAGLAACRQSSPPRCSSAGPLGCNVAPVADLASEGCEQLRRCLADRQWDDGETLTGMSLCERPSSPRPAPSPAGPVLATASMSVELRRGGPPENAVYAFVRNSAGWCPAAELLGPMWLRGGYCETAVVADWPDAAATADSRLTFTAERVCRTPLDAGEREAGVSDLAERNTAQSRFRVTPHGIEAQQGAGAP